MFSQEDENTIVFTQKDLVHTTMKELYREEIDKLYITDVVHKYDFGLARITKKAIVGQKHTRKKGDRHQLWGFLLCRVDEDTKIATIEVVCSRVGAKGTGQFLIEMLIEKLKGETDTRLVELYCLPKDRLRAFYVSLGFIQKKVMVPEKKPSVKLYQMIKIIS
jgi:hypothetical protein